MTVRCVIVDDNRAVLRAAGDLLEVEGMTVVGLARTGEDALRLVEELAPDVVLLDILLGSESGFDATRRLVESFYKGGASPTILISTHEEVDFEDLIASSGAIGFLSKPDLSAAAIRRILGRRHEGDAIETRGK
jgi:CheY-like chemotaxis protein